LRKPGYAATLGAFAVEPRATISGSKNSSSAETLEPSICPTRILAPFRTPYSASSSRWWIRRRPGACRWTTGVRDNTGLALGVLAATGVAYLVHPEHGGSGIAPGTYVIRRQRERGRLPSRLSDTAIMSRFIAD